ncbi:MAG: hypothetical protein IPN23_04360 [Elusimicrobia bacterium]|nr:hypothetical protein [Elusimicrobiota bacterium]
MKTSLAQRWIASVTTGAYLFTVIGAAPVEASFWEDRARARRSDAAPSGPGPLLAQRPAALRVSWTPVGSAALSAPVPRPEPSVPGWARAAVSRHGEVRNLWEGPARGPRVFLLLDAHDVVSAQRNIAGFLAQFSSTARPVIGVEGTSGAFAFDRYRDLLAPADQRALAEHLLKKGFLNGVELFALTAETAPALWGVEDPALYDAHVRAYRASLPVSDKTRAALARLKTDSQEAADRLFSPELRALDKEIAARHEDRSDAARYAAVLAEALGDAAGPQTRRFLSAKRLEEGFAFPDVEQARAAFIERVSPRLSPFETQHLVRLTAEFRAGGLSGRDYYARLEETAASKGVPVSAYPPFQKYIRYVAAAEAVDPTALLEEWDVSEDRAYARRSRPSERPLIEWIQDLRLAERAVTHALTPVEWERVRARRARWGDWVERATALGAPVDAATDLRSTLPVFESFCEAADARNAALLDNALAAAERRGARDVVLVTGGFHAPALRRLLEVKGLSHAVVAPFVTEVPEDGTGYLQAFASTRTPLERLLLGDRLFMNPPSATSVAVQDPASPFHAAAKALDRAALVYSVPLVRGADLNGFIAKGGWKATAAWDATGDRRTVEIRFAGSAQSVMVASPRDGAAASGEGLARSVEETGARVVETDTVGGVPYALGGKTLVRAIPEWIAGAAFLMWWGAASLAPPALLWGLGAGAIAGGLMLRGMILGAAFLHGAGHAAAARTEGGASFRGSLAAYARSLGWTGLVPFAPVFLPGLSPEKEAPKMDIGPMADGAARRVALAGPLANLTAVGLVAPFLSLTGTLGLTDLVLAAFAGINLWTALASVSDLRTALSGVGRVLACGVVGVVYGGPNPKSETLPEGVQRLMDGAVLRTLHRGGQSGGVAAVAVRENGHAEFSFFVEKTAKERDRRARLGALMRAGMARLAARAQKAGFGGLRRLVVIGHTRYGTNLAQPVAVNAHPHTSAGETDTVLYIGDGKRDAKYERPWERPVDAPTVKSVALPRGVAIAHNGDDNATVLFRRGDRKVELSNEDDARLSERMTGHQNPAQGDSPQIATRFDRWITQGSVRASLRLALLNTSLESLPGEDLSAEEVLARAPTPATLDGLMQAKTFQGFAAELEALHRRHPAATHGEALFAAAGARGVSDEAVWDLEDAVPFVGGSDIEKLRNTLADQSRAVFKILPWFAALEGADQARAARRFADLYLKFFFTGDLRRAGVHLLRRADPTSTFGVMAGTLLEGESAVWLRQRQPFYLWMSTDGLSVAGSSEAKAFLGARAGESPFRHRLTLKNGEVATLRGTRLVIDHVERGRVASYDLSRPAEAFADARWLDLETSPHVTASTSEAVPAEKRVRDDTETIPWVNAKLAEDFADPKSNNSRSADALVGLLADRLAKRKSAGGGIDLVIVGTEKSFDAASAHARILEKISSLAGRRLNVRVVYGAEFTREDLVQMRDEGFGADTVVLGLTSSGQTANTFYALEGLHAAWRGLREKAGLPDDATPPHFLVSADIDNPYTEEVLGQGLGAGDPFKARNFVTFPALDPFHPAEAATVTHKATERLLKEVSARFAAALAAKSRRWAGGGLPGHIPGSIRRMVDNGDELDRRITGLDADGNPHRHLRRTGETNDIPDQIGAGADRLSQAFLESLWATGATALFIAVTLLFHATPASVLLSGFPNEAYLFADGVPLLAAGVGLLTVAGAAWKTRAWRWHGLFAALGGVAVFGAGLFAGESLVLALDAAGRAAGWGALGTGWGSLPLGLDVSPVNLVNAFTYIFFFFGFTLALRKYQGRPLWDRLGGRVLVLADAQHSIARLSAARWRRMLSHRFGWMGLNSINESSLGRLTHEEALNSNVRGNIYLQGEARHAEGPTLMNYKQLGGSPNGPGRVWRMGIGHKPRAQASAAYSEGYISLHMKSDDVAGSDPDLAVLQDLVQDGPARDTAGMVLSLEVAERMAGIRPLNFVVGMTSSEAKTSTTQQPFAPLSEGEVRAVFGLAPRLETRAATAEILPDPLPEVGPSVGTPAAAPARKSSPPRPTDVEVPPSPSDTAPRVAGWVWRWTRMAALALVVVILSSSGERVLSSARNALDRPAPAVVGSLVGAETVQKSVPAGVQNVAPPVVVLEAAVPLTTRVWYHAKGTGELKLKKGMIPAGTALTVIRRNPEKTLVRVRAQTPGARAVWVRAAEFDRGTRVRTEAAPVTSFNPPNIPLSQQAVPLDAAGAPWLAPVVPVLSMVGRRRAAQNKTPGALLRRRLLGGARAWSVADRPWAEALAGYLEKPTDTDWAEQALRTALAYGALGGARWGADRGWQNDFRETRSILKGAALSPREGRALTTLARRAAAWTRGGSPTAFSDGAVAVLDLTEAEKETHLWHHWAAAAERTARGEPAPVLVARSERQRERLEAAWAAWRGEAPPAGAWVYLDVLDGRTVTRGTDGLPATVRLGGVLKAAGVNPDRLSAVDVVSGVGGAHAWDRSDLPANVVVRMIIGLLRELTLTAVLDEAQNALRSARAALTAA